jgi:hypothetical protein
MISHYLLLLRCNELVPGDLDYNMGWIVWDGLMKDVNFWMSLAQISLLPQKLKMANKICASDAFWWMFKQIGRGRLVGKVTNLKVLVDWIR